MLIVSDAQIILCLLEIGVYILIRIVFLMMLMAYAIWRLADSLNLNLLALRCNQTIEDLLIQPERFSHHQTQLH